MLNDLLGLVGVECNVVILILVINQLNAQILVL